MKRKADDDPSFDNNVKIIKTEKDAAAADYSQDVKKKINASNRTGQACDRCRVRKMRCDDNVNGCAPCLQNQSECKTTDRISGKATVRGYLQSLERRVEELESHNRLLQARLASLGEDIPDFEPKIKHEDPATAPLVQWHEEQRVGTHSAWDNNGGGTRGSDHGENSFGGIMINRPMSAEESSSRLPEFRSGLAGNNYLGVSTGNSLLSSIRGTSMSVLGMEIDLADYMSADLDEPDPTPAGTRPPVYNKSYRAFVQTAFGTSPKLSKVELPPKSEGITYAHVYFRVTNPYLPVIHKPSFMATLTRIYDDPNFQPSIAETVMVHTMFAIMYCQYATRAPKSADHKAELHQSSNFHYHYALGFFAQLVASHTLADVQALTMLCLHIRNLPKPGACWMITSVVLNLAIELGLHRSATRWAPSTERSILEIELRKRVFWSILVIHVIIAGNLGRPMALRSDDWDVELFEAIDDDLLSEAGIDTSKPGKCNFLVGHQASRMIPIYMDLYNSIYAVKRSPQTYVNTVRRLEGRIRDWMEQWPQELREESACDNELGRVHSQYLAIWGLHARLLLRHPSLSLSTSAEFNSENLTVCMEVSQKMLNHVKQLRRYMSLDGTWQTTALYVLAVATSLFGHWERRDQMTSVSLASLREDMDSWLSIIGDMSNLLGSGRRLQDAVRVPVDNTLSRLAQHLSAQAPSFPISTNDQYGSLSRTVTPPHASTTSSQSNVYEAYPTPNGVVNSHAHANTPRNMYLAGPNTNEPIRSPHAFSNHAQYSFNATYGSSPPTYPSPLPATAAAANAYMSAYPNQAAQHAQTFSQNATYANFHSPGSPSSWRTWAGNMASNLEPGPEYIDSASALMQLGGRGEESVEQSIHSGVDMQHGSALNGATAQMWPFNTFNSGPAG
ncbi:MAG: hypothetical protein ASARMPRED_004654 [Alectoria sarmentosa]|nr:MAG: hypothetical protein ASARMPRED_004654 [Alectoria sarmentosa]